MKLIGFRRVDVSRKDMELHGYNLFCSYPADKVTGEVAERLWVSDRVFGDGGRLRVGAEVTPRYNKYGKIYALEID